MQRLVIFNVGIANELNSLYRDVFLSTVRVTDQGRENTGPVQVAVASCTRPTNIFYGDTNLELATGILRGNTFGHTLLVEH